MQKNYKIKNENIAEQIRNIVDFMPEEVVKMYDFHYTDKNNNERKINIDIQKRIEFNGEEFFNEYETEMRTYINGDKLNYHYIEYASYEDESDKIFDDIKQDRKYNIDFIFYMINNFNNI